MPLSALEPAVEKDLLLSLQLTLRLQREGPHSAWTALLSAPGQGTQLSFASLPALIGYIARLDQMPPHGGLR